MSWLTHILDRPISQSAVRNAVTGPGPTDSPARIGSCQVWKKRSLSIALPAVAVLAVLNIYLKLRGEDGHQRQEFVPYEHMRIHNKRFPWGAGQRSLFHNPEVNPLPKGYED